MNASLTTNEAFQRQLDRILASDCFRSAASLRRLLQFLAEAAVAGRGDALKEYTVGVEGLGRSQQYDPRDDATVRVLTGKLRKRLEEYYRTEGANETFRFEIPKGGFRLQLVPIHPDSAGLGRSIARWRFVAAGLALLLLASLAVHALRPFHRQASSEWTPELETFWAPFLDGGRPVLLSHGTPLFLSAGELTFRHPMLNDWDKVQLDPNFLAMQKKLGLEFKRPVYSYAGSGDVHGIFLLTRLLGSRVPQLQVKRGAVLAWEDIQNSHLVFVGGGKSQDKLRSILADRDFAIEAERVVNRRPAPGERHEYPSVRDPNSTEFLEEHAVITGVPGYSPKSRILILASYSNPGIWAAVQAVTHPEYASNLLQHLRQPDGGLPNAYQMLLRVRFHANVPVRIEYVTHHLVKGQAN